MKKHTEARLEDAIVDELVMQGGYAFVDYNAGAAEGAYDAKRALDPDLVYMATRLSRDKTYFFPFNLGHKNRVRNPPDNILTKLANRSD